MAKNPLDKLFQDKLKNHEISPSADAWSKLEFMLDEPAGTTQKRKGFFWWSVAAAVILLALSVGVWQFARNGKNEDTYAGNKKEDSLKLKLEKNKIIPFQDANEGIAKQDKNQVEEKIEKNQEKLENKSPKIIDNQYVKSKNPNQIKNQSELKKRPNLENEKVKILKDKTELPDNQLIKNQEEENKIAQNQEKVNTLQENKITIKVTVKISKNANPAPETALANNETPERKKGMKKVIENIRDVKNGNKPIKLFGVEADRLFASIGKGN